MHVDRRILFEYANVWTGKVLNPERKSCGFKNIRILVDEALVFYPVIRTPEKVTKHAKYERERTALIID